MAELATPLFDPRPRSLWVRDLVARSRRRLAELDHATLRDLLEDALYHERKRLERELLLAQQNAAVADQVVSTFLATMRYEFHAPMASIIELLEKEQARLAGQPVSQTLDRVCESTRELLTRMDKHLNCAAEPDH